MQDPRVPSRQRVPRQVVSALRGAELGLWAAMASTSMRKELARKH